MKITRNVANNPQIELVIELTPEEMYNAYRTQDLAYLEEDARKHVSEYFEDSAYPDFSEDRGLIEVCVERFEDESDCNVADNDTWDYIVTREVQKFFKDLDEEMDECKDCPPRTVGKLALKSGSTFSIMLPALVSNIKLKRAGAYVCYEGETHPLWEGETPEADARVEMLMRRFNELHSLSDYPVYTKVSYPTTGLSLVKEGSKNV